MAPISGADHLAQADLRGCDLREFASSAWAALNQARTSHGVP